MKILTDEMVDAIKESMEAYIGADYTKAVKYADRMYAIIDAALEIAKDTEYTGE